MPVGLGLGSSHNSWVIMKDVEEWQELYQTVTRGKPQPPEAALETPDVLQSYIGRIDHSLQGLAQQLASYDPELLIIIGGDQTEMFDGSNVPNIMIYLGEEVWGHNVKRFQQPSDATKFRLKVDADTSRLLLHRLVTQEGFDVAFSDVFEASGARAGSRGGISHAFARPAPLIMPRGDLPTVLIWLNTYDPPSLPAGRCYELGRSLTRLLRDDPRRIAILGSGGLSHDPGGPRCGWIDVPLDRWFLDKLAKGNGQETTAMYTFDSLAMRSGTGEMRAWIAVAGAMEEAGSRAVVLDYIPAYHSVTGLGFAYWPAPERVAHA